MGSRLDFDWLTVCMNIHAIRGYKVYHTTIPSPHMQLQMVAAVNHTHAFELKYAIGGWGVGGWARVGLGVGVAWELRAKIAEQKAMGWPGITSKAVE